MELRRGGHTRVTTVTIRRTDLARTACNRFEAGGVTSGTGGVVMCAGRIRGSRGVAALVALAIVSVLSVAAGADRDIPVQFAGRVQWIAGEVLIVATDDDESISVDLAHVPQDEYQRLRNNDRVVVTGSISSEQSRVVATSIETVEP